MNPLFNFEQERAAGLLGQSVDPEQNLGGLLKGIAQQVWDKWTFPAKVLMAKPGEGATLEQAADWAAGTAVDRAMMPARVPVKPGEVALGAGPIRAYHGSPHDFERFDLSKIGTGEGAQAYGHGLYFAENEGVARQYRDQLAHRAVDASTPEGTAYFALQHAGGDRDLASASLVQRMDEMKRRGWLDEKSSDLLWGAIDNIRGGKPLTPGRMYEVNIHADPQRFLDWDRPMRDQSPAVRDAVKSAYGYDPAVINTTKPPTGGTFYRSGNPLNEALTSKELADAGIPGITYLDAGSRGAGAGSANKVVFDDRLIEILRKYGLAGLGLGLPAAMSMRPGLFPLPQGSQ